jgi:hypothetical protein
MAMFLMRYARASIMLNSATSKPDRHANVVRIERIGRNAWRACELRNSLTRQRSDLANGRQTRPYQATPV